MRELFIDVDGVLVDFHTPFFERCPIVDRTVGVYSLTAICAMTHDEIVATLDAVSPTFYAELTPYPWAYQLLGMGPVRLVTDNLGKADIAKGKQLMLSRHFGKEVIHISSESRHLLAGPDRWLIDDCPSNVYAWNAAGGTAILFPRWWNTNHEWNDSPVLYLGSELQRLGWWTSDSK